MRSFLFALTLLLSAPPALARVWTPPEGCEAYLTVQAKACRVSIHYTCDADQPGDKWRADFDQEGLFFQSRINDEAEWVESREVNPPVVQTLDASPKDPASFSELISSGIDTFAFSLSRTDGSNTEVAGFDRLTGKTITIDGVALEQTEFEAVETDSDGTIVGQSRGNEYVSREWRLFFAGPGETDLGDGLWRPIDGSPLQFIQPGEQGFAEAMPLFDCDALSADAGLPQTVWKARHEP